MFNKLKGTFDRSVAAVSVKSETLVDSSRTKTAITSAQNQITALTNALGQKVYQSWKAGNTDVSVFAEDLEHIVQLEQEIAAANNAKEILDGKTLEIKTKAGKSGKLFGAVTTKDVSLQIKQQFSLDVDKHKIVMNDIKDIGTYSAKIKLYTGISAEITVNVSEQ